MHDRCWNATLGRIQPPLYCPGCLLASQPLPAVDHNLGLFTVFLLSVISPVFLVLVEASYVPTFTTDVTCQSFEYYVRLLLPIAAAAAALGFVTFRVNTDWLCHQFLPGVLGLATACLHGFLLLLLAATQCQDNTLLLSALLIHTANLLFGPCFLRYVAPINPTVE